MSPAEPLQRSDSRSPRQPVRAGLSPTGCPEWGTVRARKGSRLDGGRERESLSFTLMRTTTARVEPAPQQVISRLRVGLGTCIALYVEAPQRSTAVAGLAAAWEAITKVDRLMHP